ncbi:MAG: hypothetical protein K0R98_271 [Rickettsiaceae bacterium]|jgi:hypothetical protein|nr:hypothetical protein [Rickettsiaceae bacterium]
MVSPNHYIDKPLKPTIVKELQRFRERHGYVPEDLQKKMEVEQLRCQTMTDSSIGKERKKRAAITFIGTVIGAIAICAITASPIGLALFAAPAIQAILSIGTVKMSREKRLEGAAKSVIALYEKELQDKANNPEKQPEKVKEDEKKKTREALVELIKEDPELGADIAARVAAIRPDKKRLDLDKNKEDALRIPAFHGISNRGNLDLAIY